jgi:predicted RNA-binding protein YlqC (UPF0109 family)
MKNLLTEIAMQLVDYPEQVKVNEIDGGHTMVLELSVAKQDIGKIIGKKGGNIGKSGLSLRYWNSPLTMGYNHVHLPRHRNQRYPT